MGIVAAIVWSAIQSVEVMALEVSGWYRKCMMVIGIEQMDEALSVVLDGMSTWMWKSLDDEESWNEDELDEKVLWIWVYLQEDSGWQWWEEQCDTGLKIWDCAWMEYFLKINLILG